MDNDLNAWVFISDAKKCKYHIAYDQRIDAIVYKHYGMHEADYELFTDSTYFELQLEAARCGFERCAHERLRACVHKAAHDHVIDSGVLWLNSLVWDGVPRVDKFCHAYLGCEANEYTTAVSRYIWTALAGRTLSPGCGAPMVPVLVGTQGIGKSLAIKAMSDIDSFAVFSFYDRDDNAARKMRGCQVAEIAELTGIRSRDKEQIKEWITRTHERWTPKYKEFETTYARRMLMFGSTNDNAFLDEDASGNRRWLPLQCGQVGLIEVDLIEAHCQQLWAEGAHMFKTSGIAIYEAEQLAKNEHAAFTDEDPFEDKLINWLKFNLQEEFKLETVLFEACQIDLKSPQLFSARKRVANLLRKHKYENFTKRADGILGKYWRKPSS